MCRANGRRVIGQTEPRRDIRNSRDTPGVRRPRWRASSASWLGTNRTCESLPADAYRATRESRCSPPPPTSPGGPWSIPLSPGREQRGENSPSLGNARPRRLRRQKDFPHRRGRRINCKCKISNFKSSFGIAHGHGQAQGFFVNVRRSAGADCEFRSSAGVSFSNRGLQFESHSHAHPAASERCRQPRAQGVEQSPQEKGQRLKFGFRMFQFHLLFEINRRTAPAPWPA